MVNEEELAGRAEVGRSGSADYSAAESARAASLARSSQVSALSATNRIATSLARNSRDNVAPLMNGNVASMNLVDQRSGLAFAHDRPYPVMATPQTSNPGRGSCTMMNVAGPMGSKLRTFRPRTASGKENRRPSRKTHEDAMNRSVGLRINPSGCEW